MKTNTELLEACTLLLEAMRGLIRQLPNDERLADYNLDACEAAEQRAIEVIESVKSN